MPIITFRFKNIRSVIVCGGMIETVHIQLEKEKKRKREIGEKREEKKEERKKRVKSKELTRFLMHQNRIGRNVLCCPAQLFQQVCSSNWYCGIVYQVCLSLRLLVRTKITNITQNSKLRSNPLHSIPIHGPKINENLIADCSVPICYCSLVFQS